jgi:protein-tyrosine phosphatase
MAEAFLAVQQEDGRHLPAERLREGAAFVRAQRALGRPVLVLCGAGMSRSVTFVLAYLHEEGWELSDAIRHVVRHRRQALPHLRLLRCLIDCYEADTTASALLTALLQERKRMREGP